MPDIGTRATEKEIAALQKKLRKVYSEAAKDIQRKLDEHNAKFATKNAQKLAQKEAGKITQEEYDSWVKGQVFMGEQWEAKADEIARTMTNANKEAAKLVREGTLSTFATNMNYELYQLEKQLGVQTGFNLYNAKSVSRLLKDKPKMLPEWKINEKKDYKWNRQKVENFITQGIIQGEGIPEIAKRLTVGLSARNEDKMRMFARTANTGAQNAGRQEMMEEAEDDGIEVEKTWVATLDDRTRDAHQELDGQTVPVKEPFVYGKDEIMFPGDPNAEPYLTYNCRCTLKEHYKGVKPGQRRAYRNVTDENGKTHRESYITDAQTYKEWKAAKGMGFEEWKEKRQPEAIAPEIHSEPKDNAFKFEIPDDVRETITREGAAEDWFEYEKANVMREYIETGEMPERYMFSGGYDDIPLDERRQLAAEAEMIQAEAETTKTGYKTLYRGMVLEENDAKELFNVGDMYEFSSLSATATTKKAAGIYMDVENAGGFGVPVIMEIQKPDGIYGFDRNDGLEVVLPKGSKFRIERNYKDKDGVIHISLYSKKGNNVNRQFTKERGKIAKGRLI